MEPKPKEIQVMKARGRKLLDELAGFMFIWGNRGHDFKGTISRQWDRRVAPLGNTILSQLNKTGSSDREKAVRITAAMLRSVELCRSILISLAKDESVKESDLDALTAIHKTQNSVIRFSSRNPEAGSFFLKCPTVTLIVQRAGSVLDWVLHRPCLST